MWGCMQGSAPIQNSSHRYWEKSELPQPAQCCHYLLHLSVLAEQNLICFEGRLEGEMAVDLCWRTESQDRNPKSHVSPLPHQVCCKFLRPHCFCRSSQIDRSQLSGLRKYQKLLAVQKYLHWRTVKALLESLYSSVERSGLLLGSWRKLLSSAVEGEASRTIALGFETPPPDKLVFVLWVIASLPPFWQAQELAQHCLEYCLVQIGRELKHHLPAQVQLAKCRLRCHLDYRWNPLSAAAFQTAAEHPEKDTCLFSAGWSAASALFLQEVPLRKSSPHPWRHFPQALQSIVEEKQLCSSTAIPLLSFWLCSQRSSIMLTCFLSFQKFCGFESIWSFGHKRLRALQLLQRKSRLSNNSFVLLSQIK